MLKLNSVTFKDDKTEKIVEVYLTDGHVTTNSSFTTDEFATCSFYAGLLFAGGISELEKFIKR